MNYNKVFKNAKALEILVENIYTEDQLMHNFLGNFQKGVKYSLLKYQPIKHNWEVKKNALIKNQYLYFTYELIFLI